MSNAFAHFALLGIALAVCTATAEAQTTQTVTFAVTGITKVAEGALGVSYRLDATAAAGLIASATKVVTYTITGGT